MCVSAIFPHSIPLFLSLYLLQEPQKERREMMRLVAHTIALITLYSLCAHSTDINLPLHLKSTISTTPPLLLYVSVYYYEYGTQYAFERDSQYILYKWKIIYAYNLYMHTMKIKLKTLTPYLRIHSMIDTHTHTHTYNLF